MRMCSDPKSLKAILLTLCLLIVPMMLPAQTVKWAGNPEYTSVERISDHLFKIEVKGRFGIIDFNGDVVLKPEMDKITSFSEGKALALTNAANGFALSGIISEDGKTNFITEETYYVSGFDFFSEGLLPVFNSEGRCGYIDTDAKVAIPFLYSSGRPFSEGMASVGKANNSKLGFIRKAADFFTFEEDVAYIDKFGNEFKLDKSLKSITLGTSFYQGEAVVRIKGKKNTNEFLKIGKDGKILQRNINPDLSGIDWMFRLSGESEPQARIASDRNAPEPYEESGRFGYKMADGSIFLPAQFISATPFSDGLACVEIERGKAGIIQFIREPIEFDAVQGAAAQEEGKEDVIVSAKLPASYQDKELEIRCHDAKGAESTFPFPQGGGASAEERATKIVLPDGKCEIALVSDGLVLSKKELTLETVVSLTVTISAKNGQRADAKDRFPFTVTFSNTGPKEVTLPVSITGSSVSSVTVPAGKKKYLTGYFTKVIKEENRTATVTYGKDGKTVSKTIKVKPIF
ncbi:MAG: WG repeat-containing protein [Bacteroidales bacterium]|nr:WG repeat-containing protein [Bacteroidales bacterium]